MRKKNSLKKISLANFLFLFFVDKETKSCYDGFVSKESKLQLQRREFICLNLNHRMNKTQNKQ